jgi:hypothetical protein
VGVMIFIYPLHNFHFKNSKNKDTSLFKRQNKAILDNAISCVTKLLRLCFYFFLQ